MLVPHQKITPNFGDLISGQFESKNNLVFLRKFVPNKNLAWTGSGRTALRHILETKNIKKIGIPSFTCHVVLEAAKRAGSEPVFIDSGAVANIKNIEKSIKKIDALVLPYNFGFLPDIPKIASLCKKNKVMLIEDCAQSLGATYNKKLAGSFGDYAFYSFGISKNLGFLGGMISSDSDIAKVSLPLYPVKKIAKAKTEAMISRLFFNRNLYPLFHSMLKKELKLKHELLEYRMPNYGKRIVIHQSKRYQKILNLRKANAKLCMEELDGIINFIKPIKGSDPAWLYFVLLSKQRQKLIKELRKEKVDTQPLLTYTDLSRKGKLASKVEKQHTVFALYRDQKETEYIIKKIKKVAKDGDY